MMDTDVDLERLAEKLAREGREGVKWEIRKLQWIREERAKRQQIEKTESAEG